MAEYIDRSELLRIEKLLDTDILRKSKTASTIYDQMMYDITHIPAAGDVAPVKHGKWVQCFEDWRHQIEGDKCSVCGFESYGTCISHYHYCPNCGAKMEGE